MEETVVWAEALSAGTLAQKAELIVLTKALQVGQGKKLYIYIDSRYGFSTVHIHDAIYRERGLLMAEGRTIKNKQRDPESPASHMATPRNDCYGLPGTSDREDPVSRANRRVDTAA